jgi:hypothetical protein
MAIITSRKGVLTERISDKTLYLNADRTKVVEGDNNPEAAFLLVREGAALSQSDADQYGVKLQEVPAYDAVADHAAKHGAESDAEAAAKRKAMFNKPDADGEPQEGERGTGAKNSKAARENKSLVSTDEAAPNTETKAD